MFKKISLLFLPLLFMMPAVTFAQTDQPGLIVPAVSVQDIKTDQTSFVAGNTVKGTFDISNPSDSDAANIYYKISLVGDYQANTLAGKLYDTSKLLGPVSVDIGKSLTIPFDYTLPVSVSGSDLGIQIQAFMESGIPLSWSDEKITVKQNGNAANYLSIASASLILGTTSFDLQDGPIIHQGEVPVLRVELASLPKSDINVVPSIELYDRSVLGSPILSTTSVAILLGASSKSEFSIQLPLLTDAKVYDARVILKTAQGVEVSAPMDVRYIVSGNIATIQSFTVDKQVANVGDVINASAQYTGAPFDIRTGDVANGGNGIMNLSLYNEKDELVGQMENTVDLSGGGNTDTLAITATKPSKALRGIVTISKDVAIVAQYSTNFSTQYDVEKNSASSKPATQNVTFIGFLIAAIIILFIVFFVVIRKHKGPGSMSIMFILATATLWAMSGNVAHAFNHAPWEDHIVATYNTPLKGSTISGNTANGYGLIGTINMSPGQTFWLSGNVVSPVCANASQDMNFTLTFLGKTYGYSRHTNAQGGEATTAYTYQFSYGRSAAAPFVAPSTPGNYVLHVFINATTHFRSGTTYGSISDDIVIHVLPPPPTNLSFQCSADGTQATLSWTPAPGYPFVYFRSYEVGDGDTATSCSASGCNGTWGKGNVGEKDIDELGGNSLNLSVTPGETYRWWLLTDVSPTKWSNGVFGPPIKCTSQTQNFSCSTPASTSHSTFCLDDSTDLTSNATTTFVGSCTSAKCEYQCNAPYVPNVDGTACVLASESCTYTIGDWGDCVNGKQHRTVTESPIGCLGLTPSDTRDCGTSSIGTGKCYPTIDSVKPITSANVGQLVTWIATPVDGAVDYVWSGTDVSISNPPSGLRFPIRYSTIGNKKMTLQIDGGTPTSCTDLNNGLQNGLPIGNNAIFQPI